MLKKFALITLVHYACCFGAIDWNSIDPDSITADLASKELELHEDHEIYLVDLMKNLAHATQESNACKKSISEIKSLKTTQTQLTDQLEVCNENLKKISEEKTRLEQRIKDQSGGLSAQEAKQLQEEYRQLENSKNAIQTELATTKANLKTTQELANKAKQWQDERDALAAQVEQLKAKKADTTAQDKLAAQLKQAQETNKALQDENNSLTHELAQTHQAATALAQAQEDAQQIQRQLDALKKEYDKTKAELVQRQGPSLAEQTAMHEAQTLKDDVAKAKDGMKALIKTLDEMAKLVA
jgi:chromosome segregation ATPase